MSIEEDKKRYDAAAHAMQTGVAYEMSVYGDGIAATSPKHLRVGVNSALADIEGLVTLLMSKGLFTREEYYTAIADAMEREKQRYQQRVPPNVELV
jgi:hypothetical protein